MMTILSGLLLGFGFGYVLENAGFGSPCKLTAQFKLTDWSVFKVMFTAIVFTSVGLMVLGQFGLVDMDNIFIPPAFMIAAGLGGALVGAGFAIGGYCPGTSIVGFVSGRLDAIVFLIGLLIGTFIFAGAFSSIESLTSAGEYAKGDTLSDALGISNLVINALMVVMAIGIFWLGTWMEKKSATGPVTAQEAVDGAK
jgi:hypothetical protein